MTSGVPAGLQGLGWYAGDRARREVLARSRRRLGRLHQPLGVLAAARRRRGRPAERRGRARQARHGARDSSPPRHCGSGGPSPTRRRSGRRPRRRRSSASTRRSASPSACASSGATAAVTLIVGKGERYILEPTDDPLVWLVRGGRWSGEPARFLLDEHGEVAGANFAGNPLWRVRVGSALSRRRRRRLTAATPPPSAAPAPASPAPASPRWAAAR